MTPPTTLSGHTGTTRRGIIQLPARPQIASDKIGASGNRRRGARGIGREMQAVVLMVCRLVEVLDRIQGQLWRQARLIHLDRIRHLEEFQRRTVFSILVVCELQVVDRDQLLALEGTDDDLVSVSIVLDDRCDEVRQYRLQQKTHDQHPGSYHLL